MEALKNDLRKLLSALDYNADKEEFINSFLLSCYQRTVAELMATLPEETAQRFSLEMLAKHYPSLEEGLKVYFPQEKFANVFRNVVSADIKEAIEVVVPELHEDQLVKLNTFLNTAQRH